MNLKVEFKKVSYENAKLVALACLTIDDLYVISNIRIINSKKGLFVAMPAYKKDNGYISIFNINDFRVKREIENFILSQYLIFTSELNKNSI